MEFKIITLTWKTTSQGCKYFGRKSVKLKILSHFEEYNNNKKMNIYLWIKSSKNIINITKFLSNKSQALW